MSAAADLQLVEQRVALREVLDRDHPRALLGVDEVHRSDRDDGRERGAVAALEARLVLAGAGRRRLLERSGELLVAILGPPRERRARAEQLLPRVAGDLADAVVHVHDHPAAVGQLVGHEHAVGDRVEHARS